MSLEDNPNVIYARTKDWQNAWHIAAHVGSLELLEALHRQGRGGTRKPLPGEPLPVNSKNRKGQTPLMAAVQKGHFVAMQYIIAVGGQVRAMDNFGNTCIHYATLFGHVKLLELLLASDDADVDEEDEFKSSSGGKGKQLKADILKAGKQTVSFARQLGVSLGADLVAPTQTGLAKGRYVAFRNESGLQPIHFAAWSGQVDAARVLISYRSPLMSKSHKDSTAEVTCNGGSSPLHIAALRGHVEFSCFVLEEHVRLVASIASYMEPPEDPRLAQDDYTCTPYVIARNLRRDKVLEIVDPNNPLPSLDVLRQRQMLKRSATRAIARKSHSERSDGGSSGEVSKRHSMDQQPEHWDPFGTGLLLTSFNPLWPDENGAVSVLVVEEVVEKVVKKSNVPRISPPPIAHLKTTNVPWLPTLPRIPSVMPDDGLLQVRIHVLETDLVQLEISYEPNFQ